MSFLDKILKREVTIVFNWILDNALPPFLRDSKWLMNPLFRLVYGKEVRDLVMKFKERAYFLTEEEYAEYYSVYANTSISTKRPTDLGNKSVMAIVENVVGKNVIDVGCGRGYLSQKIASERKVEVTAADFQILDELKEFTNPKYVEANIEQLPFADNSFDTVVCTHTLEHIINIQQAIAELRRITKKRLIVVVPLQREYKYTFDLHVHFFPYLHTFKSLMRNEKAHCRLINNDIFYIEDKV